MRLLTSAWNLGGELAAMQELLMKMELDSAGILGRMRLGETWSVGQGRNVPGGIVTPETSVNGDQYSDYDHYGYTCERERLPRDLDQDNDDLQQGRFDVQYTQHPTRHEDDRGVPVPDPLSFHEVEARCRIDRMNDAGRIADPIANENDIPRETSHHASQRPDPHAPKSVSGNAFRGRRSDAPIRTTRDGRRNNMMALAIQEDALSSTTL
ncbi:hypothetical protein EK21DRAFT_86475 [Setomelanomma holmii]|uniref:Uncharacterized protein n=1 Tax=Setomelanomma holmii TaxID=210430 RepID=A0A9P4LS29_9PLEO|nr:hypothetical protein EK21DRAFT_86475 [Setomelanomma holmii]